MNRAIIGFERVDVNEISPHPKNPRRGNIEAIKNSLAVNGQFKPIVVNSRTKHIIAGNHTYKAAVSLGWENIEVVWVDVDEEEELRIMLADNKTSDMAMYDSAELASVINDIKMTELGFLGTGFEEDDIGDILSKIDDENLGNKIDGANSDQARITLYVDKDEEALLRDRLLSLAFEVRSLKIR